MRHYIVKLEFLALYIATLWSIVIVEYCTTTGEKARKIVRFVTAMDNENIGKKNIYGYHFSKST